MALASIPGATDQSASVTSTTVSRASGPGVGPTPPAPTLQSLGLDSGSEALTASAVSKVVTFNITFASPPSKVKGWLVPPNSSGGFIEVTDDPTARTGTQATFYFANAIPGAGWTLEWEAIA